MKLRSVKLGGCEIKLVSEHEQGFMDLTAYVVILLLLNVLYISVVVLFLYFLYWLFFA